MIGTPLSSCNTARSWHSRVLSAAEQTVTDRISARHVLHVNVDVRDVHSLDRIDFHFSLGHLKVKLVHVVIISEALRLGRHDSIDNVNKVKLFDLDMMAEAKSLVAHALSCEKMLSHGLEDHVFILAR